MTKENKNEELKMTLTMNNYDKQIFPAQQVAVFPLRNQWKTASNGVAEPSPLPPPATLNTR